MLNGKTPQALDRRELLAGGAVAAGALATLATGTAVASADNGSTVNRPFNRAGYLVDDATPIAPLEVPASWDEEFDVVVVGTGGAGMASTMYLAQAGKKVLTVEKDVKWGGNTASAGAWTCPGGTKAHAEAGLEFDPEAILAEQLSTQPYLASGTQRKHLMNHILKGPEFMDWFMDQGAPLILAMPPSIFISYSLDGGSVAVNGINFAVQKSLEAGADMRLQTECVGLVSSGARVEGVKIADLVTGKETFVRAIDGVLLAGGGYAHNQAMLKEYCPTVAKTVATTCSTLGDDGTCTRMCLGIGATMIDHDSFCAFDGGLDAGTWSHPLNTQDTQLARQPWLGIDINGERYPYEWEDHYGSFSKQAAVLQALPDHWGYIFFDDEWRTKAPLSNQIGCRSCTGIETIPVSNIPIIDPTTFEEGVLVALERGVIKTSDTIEGIAEQLGIRPDLAVAAVEKWNAMCEKGVDEEYGLPGEWLAPIVTPPFHGLRIGSTMLSTRCGIAVDTSMRVLDSNSTPIEGLYAGSCLVAGGAGCSNFGMTMGSPLGGLCYTWTSGYIAAQAILGEIE